MTRKISKVLMSVALWTAFVGSAWADGVHVPARLQTVTIDGIEWTYTYDGGGVSLGIPEKDESYVVSRVNAVPRTTSGKIVIPSKLGVTRIGEYAFPVAAG